MVISPNKWELDVQGYLNTCNITAATPRKQIRDFAAGVNDLGLWSSMVCWPLRSSQNASTGTTAFSLGGLGAFNGTLVNGPTWGADYLSFVPANASMTASLPTDFSTISGFVVVNTINSNTVNGILGFGAAPFSATNSTDLATTGSNNRHLIFGAGSTTQFLSPRLSAGAHIMAVTMVPAGNVVAYEDGATLSTTSLGTGAPTLANFTLGRRFYDGGHTANVQEAFAAVFSAALTSGQYASLRSLYKSTLGTGLGLP